MIYGTADISKRSILRGNIEKISLDHGLLLRKYGSVMIVNVVSEKNLNYPVKDLPIFPIISDKSNVPLLVHLELLQEPKNCKNCQNVE